MKNNSENKHTEGKWIAGIYMNEASIYCASKKQGIAKLRFDEFDYPEEVVIANAEHIVKCVNSHDELVAALQKIADWKLPKTGQFWDKNEKEEMSYGACYGSNGERDYMKEIALSALQKAGIESLQKSSS